MPERTHDVRVACMAVADLRTAIRRARRRRNEAIYGVNLRWQSRHWIPYLCSHIRHIVEGSLTDCLGAGHRDCKLSIPDRPENCACRYCELMHFMPNILDRGSGGRSQ